LGFDLIWVLIVAQALGADAVMIGRPALWGLALGGQAGVERVLGVLQDELRGAMQVLIDLAPLARPVAWIIY
jgi:hypothetical protein